MKRLTNIETRPFHAHTHWEMQPPTRLLLLRHGETAWNIRRVIQGWKGTSLNQTGRLQAQAAAARLKKHWKFDAIVSSDIKRAMQTARIVGASQELRVRRFELARERSFGDWEGKSIDAVLEKYKLNRSEKRDPFLCFEPKGGESMARFSGRIKKMLNTLEQDYKGKTVLVVTHGGPMRLAACVALGIAWKRYYLLGRPRNTALTLIESQGGIRWVDFYNDSAHLETKQGIPKAGI